MVINDFLLCTFKGDTETTPTNYVTEIIAINTTAATFDCRLVDSGQQFTFNYNEEPWTGKDATGADYILASHEVYTGGKTDPSPDALARVTFTNNKSYLCYVDRINSTIDVIFYHYPSPELSFENNTVTKSNWNAYPVGSQITTIERYILNNDLPKANALQTTNDTDPPYLFVDLYRGDLNGTPDWNVLMNTPKFYGAILKATQGSKGYTNDRGWFKKNWPLIKDMAPEKYGLSWFRGAYLFLNLWDDGAAQADNYLEIVDDAGGWDKGDIFPIIDVELGNDGSNGRPKNRNQDASTQQIIDCTTTCAERIKEVTGRNVILYGRGAMRDRNITSKMGCDAVWNPSYTANMVRNGLEAWRLEDIVLWQYCGDGVAAISEEKLPRSIPDFGKPDISVYIEGANKPSFEKMRERLGIGNV